MTDFLPERVTGGCADAGPCPHSQWRPEVTAFASLMESQLRANDHKPGWKGENPWLLLDRLHEEAIELRDELQPGSRTDALAWRTRLGAEAADVANFAMMIADVCGALLLAPIACDGCGATDPSERCIGCMHDFGTPDRAWVRKYAARTERTAPDGGEAVHGQVVQPIRDEQ